MNELPNSSLMHTAHEDMHAKGGHTRSDTQGPHRQQDTVTHTDKHADTFLSDSQTNCVSLSVSVVCVHTCMAEFFFLQQTQIGSVSVYSSCWVDSSSLWRMLRLAGPALCFINCLSGTLQLEQDKGATFAPIHSG